MKNHMKCFTATVIALAASVPTGSAVAASSDTRLVIPTAELDQMRYTHQRNLEDLRNKAIAVKIADGGELTAKHRVELQSELDRLNSSFQRRMRNANRFSVDAFGHSVD